MTTYLYPEAIVSTEWLAANQGDPDLRIYDCTFYLDYEEGTGRPYSVRSGQADYEAGHIPGAGFLDLQGDFSDQDAPTKFMALSPEETAAAFTRHGVGDAARVVLYSRGSPTRATRFWWMLRWLGFDRAALLDGGIERWVAEGRPVATGTDSYAPAPGLSIAPRPELFCGKDRVMAAMAEGACLLNTLDPDLHAGGNARYGRAGRIPGSTNVPAKALTDPATGLLVAPEEAAAAFAAAGLSPDAPVVNYCGGGIAATLDAFLQVQLGYGDVTVYDASMSEWAKDPALPIETD
ncbi:MAG: rhodanese-like domain-containing protein [Pseudomonadota bacterium]